jgi:hypothetical protein
MSAVAAAFSNDAQLWLRVPAFTGTTAEFLGAAGNRVAAEVSDL